MEGNTWVVGVDEDEVKKDLLMRKRAQRTIDKKLWDSTWLREKYPNRFDEVYEKSELGTDIYDDALFPKDDEEVYVLNSDDGFNDNRKYMSWYSDNK